MTRYFGIGIWKFMHILKSWLFRTDSHASDIPTCEVLYYTSLYEGKIMCWRYLSILTFKTTLKSQKYIMEIKECSKQFSSKSCQKIFVTRKKKVGISILRFFFKFCEMLSFFQKISNFFEILRFWDFFKFFEILRFWDFFRNLEIFFFFSDFEILHFFHQFLKIF